MDGKFERLENHLREALTELIRLKNPDKYLPAKFDRDNAQIFLREPSILALDDAFNWASTPQGEDYWNGIAEGLTKEPPQKVPEEAIICIQNWIIESFNLDVGGPYHHRDLS